MRLATHPWLAEGTGLSLLNLGSTHLGAMQADWAETWWRLATGNLLPEDEPQLDTESAVHS